MTDHKKLYLDNATELTSYYIYFCDPKRHNTNLHLQQILNHKGGKGLY